MKLTVKTIGGAKFDIEADATLTVRDCFGFRVLAGAQS